MSDKPPDYLPYTLEKVFERLDQKLVTLGVPGALSAVGVNKVMAEQLPTAGWCFAGAAGVWLVIKIGKKLAPKLDQLLDWGIASAESALLSSWSAIRSDFTGKYLQQQARLCEEFTVEGFNPDRTAIPLLEEVFVPLDLSGALGTGALGKRISPNDMALQSENLSVWRLLARSRKDRKFRQMSIQAKGGMGKTTLLRHIALIYGQRKHRRYRAPKLVPVFLRLRDWVEELTQENPLSLPILIAEHYAPSLWKNQTLAPPPYWAKTLLEKGKALVMFDGFDELPEGKRQAVSHWISTQMWEYGQSVFILTSRPAGFKDYVAQRPAIPIFVNKFTPQQQEDFIRRWYLCQERCCRSEKQRRHAQIIAQGRSDNLIGQLRQRQTELGYMAENPLLLNMLVTFHRFDPAARLPRQRLELYRGICKLQLEDRPKARMIRMLLPFEKSQALLQTLALALVKAQRVKIQQQALLKFLNQQSIWRQEEVEAAEWLKQIVEIGELLVEREPGEYEFPHLSFQGFFAAKRLAQPQDNQGMANNAHLVLENWNGAVWRETVLLYTAQLTPKRLDWVIRQACNQGSEAAELATLCLKEYPRPEKISNDLVLLLQSLDQITQNSKYQSLEALLKAKKWSEADQETYRLMINTVGKEEGQWFSTNDLENFPCSDLQILDHLWTIYSKTKEHPNGKWGFTVQRQIWQACGSPTEYNQNWEKFGDQVGWRRKENWLAYSQLTVRHSLPGEFPAIPAVRGGGLSLELVGVVSFISQRLAQCSTREC